MIIQWKLEIGNWKLEILLLAVFISVFSVLPVKGQNAISPSISISPGLIRQSVKPGEKSVVTIKVSNLGKEPIPLAASNYSISGINNLGGPEFTKEIRPHSAVDWLELNKPDLILDSLGSQEVQVTINPPKDVVPGGYSAAIIFQARLPVNYFDKDANAKILPAISTSFLLSVNGETAPTIEKLSISSFQTPKVVVSAPVPFLTEISNPTGFFFFTDGELTITPTWGEKKIVTQLADSVLMPQSSRQYVTAYTGTIWPGIYNAKMTFRQGNKVLVASSRFVSIPWPFIIIVAILATLVVGSITYLKRRKTRRLLAAKL